MNTAKPKSLLYALIVSALLLAAPAFAGPPLLCHPFRTDGAPSLPWGGDGWNQARADYDLDRLIADVDALLAPDTPVIARMETLRRAAIYASRDGAVLRGLAARLEARIAAAAADNRALALFDAGYFRETLQDILRLQGYDMPAIGKVDAPALRALLAGGDGNARIEQALALRPQDPSLRFAAALVATADDRSADAAAHARIARAGTGQDRLLALNIAQVAR
ncbi:MAG: hypothetical protein QM761_11360 [Pseudoxanthomonas sp.]